MGTIGDFREIVVAVNPDMYYDKKDGESYDKFDKLKKIIKKNSDFSAAIKEAKDEGLLNCKPLSSYKLIYDSPANQLEPLYYWFLDFMGGLKPEKITDNFMASPGSGQFSEMGAKATAMQQQATKILADTNVVIKSIIQLIYDLKEFEIRLMHYEKANSKNSKEKEEGMMSLKNIWLDQVDLKRGRGSIHQMTYEMGYTTLRDAFLIADDVKSLDAMASKDGVINDQVKRVLIPRISEFLMWKDISEKEIRARFNIEKSYLKSQVESLKLYTRWATPYLKAAEELRMKGFDKDAALVNAFSTSMFELCLLGTSKAEIPKNYGTTYKLERPYSAVYVVSLTYRGHLGQKAGQGAQSGYTYSFGGKVEISFDCYALNSEELGLVKKTLAKRNEDAGMDLIKNNTGLALDELKDDIARFTEDKDKKKKDEERKGKEDDINPFSSLLDFSKLFDFWGKKDKDKKKVETPKDIDDDNFIEKVVRQEAIKKANSFLYTIYDIYKKAHGHASSPENFDNSSP